MKNSSFLKVLKLLTLMTIIVVAFSGKIYADEAYNGVAQRVRGEDDGVRLTDYDVSQYVLSQTTDDVTNYSNLKDITKNRSDGQEGFTNGVLPNSYQITNFGGVKNQKSTETCWMYAATKAFETTQANHYGATSQIQESDYTDYAEMFGEYATSYTFTNGTNSKGYYRELDDGGFSEVAYGYMTNGVGHVYDTDFPFTDSTSSKKPLSSIAKDARTTVTGYEYFPEIYKEYSSSGAVTYLDVDDNVLTNTQVNTIRQKIKSHIYNYGSVTTNVYFDAKYFNNGNEYSGESFFNNETGSTNHAVSIIGWDDDYSKDNFKSTNKPSTNGAYIAVNSWGPYYHTDGIFYISYEDMTVENEITGVLSVSDVDYTNIYQTDFYAQNYSMSANLSGAGASSLYLANVFTRSSSQNEAVSYVGIKLLESGSGNIYINPNGDDTSIGNATKVGTFTNLSAGYHRIPLNTTVTLTGSKFVVIVEYTAKDSIVRIPLEVNYSNRQDYINYAKSLGTIGNGVDLIGNAMYFNVKKEADYSGYSVDGRNYTNFASRTYNGLPRVPVMVNGNVYYFENGLQIDSASVEACVKVFTNKVIDYTIDYYAAGTNNKIDSQYIGQIVSGTTTTLSPKSIIGYTAPEPIEVTITSSNNAFRFDYTPNTYSVHFNARGGSGTMQVEPMTYGEDKALNTNNFTRTGYKFSGWANSSESTTVVYTDGQVVKNLSTINGDTVELYAVWTPIKYSIKFNSNGGTGSMSNMSNLEYNSSYNLATNNFTYKGHTFVGWNRDSSATTAQYTNGQAISNLSTTDGEVVNLFAIWTPNNYTIRFNNNGGTGDMADLPMTYGSSKNLTTNSFTRTGYTFKGWATSDSSTTVKYNDGAEVNNVTDVANAVVNLYAVWTPIKYSIHFDSNGGSGSMNNMTNLEYDKAYTLTANNFTKTNYAFAGWSKNPDATTAEYGNRDSVQNLTVTDGDTVTLYAVWSNNVYTIRFNSNNGENQTHSVTVEKDKSYRLDSNPFTYEGHTFQNWNTAQDGTGTAHNAGGTVTNLAGIGETIDLYAMWNVNTYKITFNKNGGGGSMPNMTLSYGESKALNANQFTRSGYTFTGWARTNTDTTPEYTDEQVVSNLTVDNNVTITLYAVWTPNNYRIHFDKNGGTGTDMADLPMVYGTAQNLTKNTYTREGYTFQGWAETDSATSVKYQDQAEVNNLTTVQDGTVNLYAVWKPFTYSISFDGNGATSGSMSNMSMTYGIAKQLSQNKFTKTGYRFTGWGETAGATTPKYADRELVNNLATVQGAEVKLYAVWAPITYVVHYNGNGSTSGEMNDQTMTYGVPANLTSNTFARTGYKFIGWGTTNRATEVAYQDGQQVENLSSTQDGIINLYAMWEPKTYSIHFEPNGGTGSMEDMTGLAYGTRYNLTANTYTRAGQVFVGWNQDQNATAAEYTDKQSITGIDCEDNGTVTLYAIWTNNAYTVRYNSNNGEELTYSGAAELNKNYTIEANTFTYRGHNFQNWNTALDGTGTSYNVGKTVKNLAGVGETIDLYAMWNPNTYTIRFNSNGGTGNMPTMKYTYDESKPLNSNVYNRVGYTFQGWATSSDSNVVEYTDSQTITNLTEENGVIIDLYAVWQPITYEIKFDSNGGTAGTMDNLQMTFDVPKNLSKNTYTREGYTFLGWAMTSNAGSIKYADEAEVNNLSATQDDVITVYAVWKANTYTIHYDANGGSGSMSDLSMTYGISKTLTANRYTKTGYSFAGWAEAADSTTVKYADKESVINLTDVPNEVVNLYAVWTPITYTIKFNSNGGSGTQMEDLSMAYDTPKSLTKNTYTRTGYSFAGWATTARATTPTYSDEEEVNNLANTQGATITLFAVWNPITYSIHFDGNTGTGSMEDMTGLKYGTSYNLNANSYTKAGFAFVGWNDDPSATTAKYTDKQAITGMDCDDGETVTLYAIWTNNAYTVKYNSNDGTDASFVGAGALNENYTIADNTFTYVGHTFQSWNTAQDGTGTSYNPGKVVKNIASVGQTINLYAMWNVNTYTVKFDKNGGTGTMSNMTYSYGESKALNENKFTRTGYTFKGWATASNSTDVEYTDKQVVSNLTDTNGEVVTLYAVWEANTYTIKFNSNGAEGTMADVELIYGETKELPQNQFVKDGNGFKGWATSAGSNTVAYSDKATVSNLSSENGAVINLYAVWGPVEYKIRFNNNGGTGSMSDLNMVYGTPKQLTQNAFTRTGYNFLGWAEDESATVATYSDKQEVNNLSNVEGTIINLYAIWSPYSYTIHFDANGGTGTMTDMTLPFNQEANLNANTYLREGYMFGSWNIAQDGSGVSFNDKQLVQGLSSTNNGTVTLYAIWNPINYTIRYNVVGDSFSGTMANQVCAYGTKYNLTENAYIKDGYHFVKWTLDEAGTSSTYYEDRQEIENLSNTEGTVIDLYGQFEINTYEIVFDPNGGQGSMSDIDATYGVSYTIPNNTITRNGYTFLGWSLNQDGSGTIYNEGDSVSNLTVENNKEVHLYAIWSANTYNITYELDGGTNDPDNPDTYTPDDEITLKNPTKTDYRFVGWTGSNGTTPEKDLTIPKGTYGDLNYTANWADREVNYTINHYKQNLDGTYNSTPDESSSGTETIHTEITVDPNDYEGFETPDSQTVQLENDDQEINFYYTRKSYTLTVIRGEGIENVQVKDRYLFEETIDPVVTYKDGYSNAVWSINDFPGSKMPARNLTVSVRANLKSYTITYNLNGGKVDGTNPTMYNSQSPDIYIISPTKEGYAFDGWTTNNPGGSIIRTGTKGNLYFTAKWVEIGGIIMPSKYDYTVEYYKQTIAGTYPSYPTETESGIGYQGSTVTPMVKSYEGYKSPDVKSVVLSEDHMTIKYYYEREKYTVTINKGEGITSVSGAGTYVYQDKVKLSAETEVDDAVVIWTCGGVIQDTVFNMPAHDMTINVFTTNELQRYYITYDLDGGYAEGNPDSFTAEDEFTLNNPTRDGYVFTGWTSDDDNSLQMTVKVEKGTKKNLHFMAHWKRIEETPDTVRYYVEEYLEKENGTFSSVPDYTSYYVGEKGSVVKVNTSDFEGFVSPEREVIVLNEEKTVRYYYSRNTYKLTIEQGPGIERIYGTNLEKNMFKFGEDFEIKADIKEGYQNLTWTENGTRIEAPYNRMPAHDVYIKCSAQIISYQITYDLKGGQISNNPTSYTIEDELTLPQPILYGYTFKGWIGSNGSNPQTTVTISKGSTGNKEYTAVWEKMQAGASMDLSIGFSTVKPTNKDVTAYIISNTKLKETGDWKYFEDEYKLHKVFSENAEEIINVEPQDGGDALPVKIIVSNIDKTAPKIEVTSYYVNDNTSKVITLKSDKYLQPINGWYTDDNLTFVKTFDSNTSETVYLTDQAGNQVSKYIVVNDLKSGVKNLSLSGTNMSQVGRVSNTAANTVSNTSNRNNAYVNNNVPDNTMDGNMPKTGSSNGALIIIGIPLLVVAVVVFRKYKLNSFRY